MNVSDAITIETTKWRRRRKRNVVSTDHFFKEGNVSIALPHVRSSKVPVRRFASSTTESSPPIVIAHSCLIIPVAVLIWWYWTKRTVQRVVRRLVTSHGHHSACSSGGPQMNSPTSVTDDQSDAYYTNASSTKDDYSPFHHEENDPFSTWDDVMHQDGASENENSNTLRFVRWFKSKGTRNTRARRRVHAATLHNLRCGAEGVDDTSSAYTPRPHTPMLEQSVSSESDMSMIHRVCTTVAGPASIYTWQCIQNTTAGSLELCAIEVTETDSNELLQTQADDMDDTGVVSKAAGTSSVT